MDISIVHKKYDEFELINPTVFLVTVEHIKKKTLKYFIIN